MASTFGAWVARQRDLHRIGKLKDGRDVELEAIPQWTWDPIDEDWTAGIAALRAFAAREGHTRVPASHIEGSVRLARWIESRRAERRAGRLDEASMAELEATLGWTWTRPTLDWRQAATALRAIVERERYEQVRRGGAEDDEGIREWVGGRRAEHVAGRLDPALAAELEALPGWTWAPEPANWAAATTALRAFAAREGHANPPRDHIEDGFRLGRWVPQRRTERGAASLQGLHAQSTRCDTWMDLGCLRGPVVHGSECPPCLRGPRRARPRARRPRRGRLQAWDLGVPAAC